MKKISSLQLFFFFISAISIAQNDTIKLKEILITSSRIELPFSENSRTISIISSEDILRSAAINVADMLQQIGGIDVRRRGIDGMQSDLYIRGGHFNQTLVLIDGIKTEDPQTGHHTMNMMIPLENIERIEIIKGPAARIFGQNAFNGAINIVTKNIIEDNAKISLTGGSFDRKSIDVTASTQLEGSSHQVHYSNNSSNGYRDNTDFDNQNFLIKSSINTKNEPITMLTSFGERKFGANNFYTNSPSFNEYEETQTSLAGVSTKFTTDAFVIKPKIYWKRNQDMFLLRREDPSFSRNFNISNKVGAEVNASYKSKIGTTGFGIDFASISLSSNNLGDQNRTMFNAFLEQRFIFANKKLDVTPGVSLNYFSDFEFQVLPGFDFGYKINDHTKFYWNVGYSYRVPTYTELYVNIPNFLSGNEDLEPEKAVTEEMGIKYQTNSFSFSTAAFYRVATDLIDYVKEEESSPFFLAQNLRKITTQGIELNTSYAFKVNDFNQGLNLNYTFLEDDYNDVNVFSSRYLINTSIKHHFTATLNTKFLKFLEQSIAYRYVERPSNSYNVVDAKIKVTIESFTMFALVNNIFDTDYSEKDFVPMPKANFVFGLSYKIK